MNKLLLSTVCCLALSASFFSCYGMKLMCCCCPSDDDDSTHHFPPPPANEEALKTIGKWADEQHYILARARIIKAVIKDALEDARKEKEERQNELNVKKERGENDLPQGPGAASS